jgi:hypothetical protein
MNKKNRKGYIKKSTPSVPAAEYCYNKKDKQGTEAGDDDFIGISDSCMPDHP